MAVLVFIFVVFVFRVEISKEETSPMQYTMDCSIDSIDSVESRDDNEEKYAQTPVLQQGCYLL